MREAFSQDTNEFIDAPVLLYTQEEGGSGGGVHTVFGFFLVTEPPLPYKSGQAKAEDEGIKAENPDIVLALDELDGNGNSHRHFLSTIGVTILLVIFANGLVGESEFRDLSKGGVVWERSTDDLYALVISTNLAATSSAVWLMASFTLSGWLRGKSITVNDCP